MGLDVGEAAAEELGARAIANASTGRRIRPHRSSGGRADPRRSCWSAPSLALPARGARRGSPRRSARCRRAGAQAHHESPRQARGRHRGRREKPVMQARHYDPRQAADAQFRRESPRSGQPWRLLHSFPCSRSSCSVAGGKTVHTAEIIPLRVGAVATMSEQLWRASAASFFRYCLPGACRRPRFRRARRQPRRDGENFLDETVDFTGSIVFLQAKVPGMVIGAIRNGDRAVVKGYGEIATTAAARLLTATPGCGLVRSPSSLPARVAGLADGGRRQGRLSPTELQDRLGWDVTIPTHDGASRSG